MKLAEMNNVDRIPAVQFTLGRLAALEATLEGLIMGQINCAGAHPVLNTALYALDTRSALPQLQ